jgi:hypothetical protein
VGKRKKEKEKEEKLLCAAILLCASRVRWEVVGNIAIAMAIDQQESPFDVIAEEEFSFPLFLMTF